MTSTTTNNKLIRVGFVGISASSRAWANATHLPALLQSPHYVIHGLLNSSVEAGRAAIEAHGLPKTTKVYTSIHDLSADPDVDLVVVSVNVAKHHEVAKPALEAGKDVYVEWPIGSNLEQSAELTELAKRKGVKTIVGLQGRHDPLPKVVQGLIAEGRVGEVLNVNVYSSIPLFDGEERRGREFISNSKSGGSVPSIPTVHLLDMVQTATGARLKQFQSLLVNTRPMILYRNPDEPKESGTLVEKDTADFVAVQGLLDSGVPLNFTMRAGKNFADGNQVRWCIYGTGGEIEVIGPSSSMQISAVVKVRVRSWDREGVEEIVVGNMDEKTGLQGGAANVRRVYGAFAEGGDVVDFEEALKWHRFLEEVYNGKLGERVIFGGQVDATA